MTVSTRAHIAPRTILIVEDSDDMRQVFVAAFEQAHYRVVSTNSVGGALAILRTRHFDVLLTDYMLGDGTGLDVFRCASLESLLERTHRILCTAHHDVHAPPGVSLLRKPIGLDELLEAAGDG
jgi:DNA-binding NtrC family response regulator